MTAHSLPLPSCMLPVPCQGHPSSDQDRKTKACHKYLSGHSCGCPVFLPHGHVISSVSGYKGTEAGHKVITPSAKFFRRSPALWPGSAGYRIIPGFLLNILA